MVFKWPLETGGLLPPRNSDGQLRVRSTKRQRQALGKSQALWEHKGSGAELGRGRLGEE